MTRTGRFQAEVERLEREDEEFQKLELVLTIASELRLAMEKTRVSQAELARRLRVTPQYVSQLLRDEGHNMTLGTLARLAKALEIRMTWHFEHLAEAEPAPDRTWICVPAAGALHPKEPTRAQLLAA
jgi:transcriptional regulator with XRE-family HTH domain